MTTLRRRAGPTGSPLPVADQGLRDALLSLRNRLRRACLQATRQAAPPAMLRMLDARLFLADALVARAGLIPYAAAAVVLRRGEQALESFNLWSGARVLPSGDERS